MHNSYIPQAVTPSTVSIGIKDIGPYYWVGQCMNGIHYYAGQTFRSTTSGKLKRIKLFPSMVYGETKAQLSVYEFDSVNYIWKEKKAEANHQITKAVEGTWITFEFSALPVKKDQCYAFRITCEGSGMLALAECPWNTMNPYADGEEWIGSSIKTEGYFHKDFDLAFEAEIESHHS